MPHLYVDLDWGVWESWSQVIIFVQESTNADNCYVHSRMVFMTEYTGQAYCECRLDPRFSTAFGRVFRRGDSLNSNCKHDFARK